MWGRLLAGAIGVDLYEGPGLVATQTRTFLFANIQSSAAMVQRLGDAYVGVLAERRRPIRTGLAAHGG